MSIIFSEQGALTIVRRSSSKRGNNSNQQKQQNLQETEITSTTPTQEYEIEEIHLSEDFQIMQSISSSVQGLSSDDQLDTVDLATDNLPAVDTPDACDKAAMR